MKEVRLLLVSFSILAVIGVPAAYSLVQDPTANVPAEVVAMGRQPASEIEMANSNVRNSAKAVSVTLDWNCNKKDSEQQVDGTHLRLRGHLCDLQKAESFSVVNESNGYTAAVILTNDKQFTTDFIELKDGDNQFQIAYFDQKGNKEIRHLTVKKRLPASLEAAAN
jgi:hypothetical protein